MERVLIKPKGFTLVELLVAVALMVILIGAVVMVFIHSAQVVGVSEAKMDIYGNARAIFEFMARDLASAQVTTTGQKFEMYQATVNQYALRFRTITSWKQPNTGSGTAVVSYQLGIGVPIGGLGTIYNLERTITRIGTDDDEDPLTNPPGLAGWEATYPTRRSILGQYVYKDSSDIIRLKLEYYDKAVGVKKFVAVPPTGITFNDTQTLPGAIRITMDIADRQRKAIRTFSRVIWIASGGN